MSILQDDGQFMFQDPVGMDMEKHNMRQKGQDLLRLKIESYSDKIKEIFETHVERPESDSDGEDVPIQKNEFVVRISRLSRVMSDLGSFVGIAFNTFKSFLANFHNTRKSEDQVVLRIQKFMWLKDHEEALQRLRENKEGIKPNKPYKQKGESILKEPSELKEKKTVTSESDKKGKEKKKSTTISFEDSLFKNEKKIRSISADQFLRYLELFYDVQDDILVFDHMLEYEKELTKNFKTETDATYDPFKEQLEDTLKSYQEKLADDTFKTDAERHILKNVVREMTRQLESHDRVKQEVKTQTDIKSVIQFSTVDSAIVDAREKGLREIFCFYALQHIPTGQDFDQIKEKRGLIDLGEFLMFCKDFQIPIFKRGSTTKFDKKVLIEIFRKTSDMRHTPLVFEQFEDSLGKLAVAIKNKEVQELKDKLEELQKMQAK